MKTAFKFFLVMFSFHLSSQLYGQLNMKYPLICHDKNNYLSCYNDGTYILSFAGGKFNEFRTVDQVLKYSDITRTLSFTQKRDSNSSFVVDTIQIIQQPNSIIFRKGISSLEINSFENIPKEVTNYHIKVDSTERWQPKFMFWLDSSYVTIEVSHFGKKWSWTIVVREKKRLFAIDYNPFKHNRVESIFAIDNNLRCGTAISTSFKTQKKIWWLQSSYVDTLATRKNGVVVIGDIDLDNHYEYSYYKSGKLKTKKTIGELKRCECD
jgi:hypothetical protein